MKICPKLSIFYRNKLKFLKKFRCAGHCMISLFILVHKMDEKVIYLACEQFYLMVILQYIPYCIYRTKIVKNSVNFTVYYMFNISPSKMLLPQCESMCGAPKYAAPLHDTQPQTPPPHQQVGGNTMIINDYTICTL